MFNKYYDKHVREVCHGVKERDPMAIKEMAQFFLNLEVINKGSILVPAPQHEGYAIYTKEIAEIITDQVGCTIADVLKSKPRKTLYEQKANKEKAILRFELISSVDGTEIYFLDNVINTGTTFREANRLLQGRLKPLVYAIS